MISSIRNQFFNRRAATPIANEDSKTLHKIQGWKEPRNTVNPEKRTIARGSQNATPKKVQSTTKMDTRRKKKLTEKDMADLMQCYEEHLASTKDLGKNNSKTRLVTAHRPKVAQRKGMSSTISTATKGKGVKQNAHQSVSKIVKCRKRDDVISSITMPRIVDNDEGWDGLLSDNGDDIMDCLSNFDDDYENWNELRSNYKARLSKFIDEFEIWEKATYSNRY